MKQTSSQSIWPLILSTAAILMITMGARQSTGLFVFPISNSTGLGIVEISFALAVGQLVWGAVQPIFGGIADRWGSHRVLILGAVMLAAGLALVPFVTSEWGLIITMGLLSAAGAGSFSLAPPHKVYPLSAAPLLETLLMQATD